MMMMAALAVVLAGCGSDEEEVGGLESFYSNVLFAGVWNVSEVNIGGTWQDAKTAGYKDSQIIITEDSCYQSFGRFGNSYGRYSISSGNKANCKDYYGKLHMVCHFKNVSGNKATATVTNKEGASLDFHMERDDNNPAIYLDPLKYLDGTWDIDGDEGGYVVLRGYAADVHHSKFDASYEVYRSTTGLWALNFGSGILAIFDMSTTPNTFHVQGRCYELNGKEINFVCTKRSE